MQYSFSQTFGKGVNLLVVSPTPSFKNSSKASSQNHSEGQNKSISKSQDGSNDKGQANIRSPVLQSYPCKQINATPACFDRRLFIERLSKQKGNIKLNQDTFRQRELKLQKQINHVDGLNERMKNLLNQLRREHSHDIKRFSNKKQPNTPESKKRQTYHDNNKQITARLDRCQSSNKIKKTTNMPNWFVNQKQKDLKQNLLQKKQKKGLESLNRGLEYQSSRKNSAKMDRCLIEENRIRYKNRLQNKVIQPKQNSNMKQKKYMHPFLQAANGQKQRYNRRYLQQSSAYLNVSSQASNCQNTNIANTNLRGRVYTSEMYENYKNKQNGRKKFSGSCQVNVKQNPSHKQIKRQGLLRNKVKTIQSQIDTNGIQIQYDQSKNQIQEVSYVEQEDALQQKQQQQSIYMAFYEKDKNKVKQNTKEIKCCNCGNKKNESLNAYQYGSFNTKQGGSNQNSDRSTGFQNKLKRISEKIQNYQKKVSGLNIGLASFDKPQAKSPYQSYRNSDRRQDQQSIIPKKLTQMPTYKKIIQIQDKKSQKQCNLKDYQCQGGHLRTVTPTWACDIIKQDNQTQQVSQTSKKPKAKIGKIEKVSGFFRVQNEFSEQLLATKRKENYVKQQKEIFNLSIKERMSYKLGASDCAQKFTKQIELDEQFRKSKKQLSKLPEDIPKISKNKWYYVQKTLIAQSKLLKNKFVRIQISKMSIKQIFQLTDEEADPFYSIAVQDLKQYEQIINQCVQYFLKAQTYFYQNLHQNFSRNQLMEIFYGKLKNTQQQNIKLDELTLMISNATKINHKCRDTYLIFKRILLNLGRIQPKQHDKSLLQQSVSINQLIKHFSHQQKEREDRKSKVKQGINDQYIQQESVKSKKTMRSMKSDKQKIDKF